MASGQPFPQKPTRPSTSVIFLPIAVLGALIILSAILYFLYCLWYSLRHKSKTSRFDDAGSPLNNLQKFSYKELNSATNSFSVSNSIGKGGSGTVFRGILSDGKLVAVKLIDCHSFQSELEFQNELEILGGLRACPFIVRLLGFCVEKGQRLLVFEYMPNRSLQEYLYFDDSNYGNNDGVRCAFGFSCLNWAVRFNIILDVAKALAFLHLGCEPPVVHGDVKPSNVLLDSEFRAKLSDFGLSRFKLEGEVGVDMVSPERSGKLNGSGGVGEVENKNDTSAIATPLRSEENDGVDFALALQATNSSKNGCKIPYNSMGLENVNCRNSNVKGDEYASYDDIENINVSSVNAGDDISRMQWGKDWWWRQDGTQELSSKDYVKEWIGTQICPDPDILDWEEDKTSSRNGAKSEKHREKNENFGKESGFEHLSNGVVEKENPNRWRKPHSLNHRKMHEWWNEENRNDICKQKKRANLRPHFGLGKCFSFRKTSRKPVQEKANDKGRKKKQRHNTRSTGSDMWSGDLLSRELSSTTSMRGTLCYVAPEYNGCGYLMEKADIYSFGVLVLVVVSGRRPLHVLASPMRLEKANLISWARSLAYSGTILELVDELLNDEYDKEQAGLCINLALACLQKLPELRPDIGDVVRVLNGEMEIPQPSFEFSPSPPSRLFSRSTGKRNGSLDYNFEDASRDAMPKV